MSLTTHRFGPHPDNFAEYGVPDTPSVRRAGTIVLIHGGFWRAAYGIENLRPLAAELVDLGWAVWNIEYRRVGAGGGWPTTLEDVAAAIDALADTDADTTRVIAIGHSAGGHLATWAAGRAGLADGAPGANPRVAVTASLSHAGVVDLATASETNVGSGAATDLIGGTVDEFPERYAVADPMAQIPLTVPTIFIHSRADTVVPISLSENYVASARLAGAHAQLIEVTGDHESHRYATSPAGIAMLTALDELEEHG